MNKCKQQNIDHSTGNMLTLAGLSVFCLILLFSFIYLKFLEKRKLLDGFPGPKGLPLLGNLFDIFKGKAPFTESRSTV
jgi:hypothetical protein